MSYVGIDLGTTNSAVAAFDGVDSQLFKSPEQHDTTPSALYFDRRGNRYVGSRAYNNAALDPDNAALLFKRQMGTGTRFPIANLGRSLSPEECSTEVLRTLHGYLPEEVRVAPEGGTVITVPAAFDQRQKEATLVAAQAAGLGRIALMQEPVAAVMAVMRKRGADGVFLIFDLGGGTLDIAVAQSIGGRVNLLAHGGIGMCGGRDFDRMIVDTVVHPWLRDAFDLGGAQAPTDQRRLFRLAAYASERAKIELSTRDSSTISLAESELNLRDGAGRELYIDAPLTRATFDGLIATQVARAVDTTRETLVKAGLEAPDVERIVFVGGPTFYPPLRERVAFELGIAGSTEVNPMTAVAEGAAVFAESVDWATESRSRKGSRGQLAAAPLSLAFHFPARTPTDVARVSLDLSRDASPGEEFQMESLDSGWSSGRRPLRHAATVDVPLPAWGENHFKAQVYDASGSLLSLPEDRLTITRVAASVDGIPASHSVAIEVQARLGEATSLDYLIREGDLLPKRGVHTYKAARALKPGDGGGLNFKLWEGDIQSPISDNRAIGVFSILASDLSDQSIPIGADLVCDYEVLDSGNIVLVVTVPAAQGAFTSGRNFYSHQEGRIDFDQATQLLNSEHDNVAQRVDQLKGHIPEDDIAPIRERLDEAQALASTGDPEQAKRASEELQRAKKLLSEAKTRNLQATREADLENCASLFNSEIRALATPADISAFDALARAAEAAMGRPDAKFEALLSDMRTKIMSILWRQDDFVVDRFTYLSESPHLFLDPPVFAELTRRGQLAIERNDSAELRRVVAEMDNNRVGSSSEADLSLAANIIKVR